MSELSQPKIIKHLGFDSKPDLENSIRGKTEQIGIAVTEVFDKFKTHVEMWVKEYLGDKRKRFVAKIERPPEGTVIKSPSRIAEKMIALHNDPQSEPITPDNFLIEMGDVARFRILCNYLSDAYHISDRVKTIDSQITKIKIKHIDSKYKDFIKTPYEERHAGHRALQHYFGYEKGDLSFVFEIQIMTLLEHGWDKKDHHLIYEDVRVGNGDKIPQPLKNLVAAMSELLYVADTVFEDLKEEIGKKIGDK